MDDNKDKDFLDQDLDWDINLEDGHQDDLEEEDIRQVRFAPAMGALNQLLGRGL